MLRCFIVSCDEKVRLYEFNEQGIRPVMGVAFNKDIFSGYKGRKVYFCYPGLKPEFERNPGKYPAIPPHFEA